MTQHQEQASHQEDILNEQDSVLILHNDFNTFDHVIHSLINVLGHDPIQAEQCAFIVHYKGKCIVKDGNFEKLLHYHKILASLGLTVSIEDQNGK
jgi:ATP-dependent Clp protease adaptor protein ClpS